MTWSPEEIDWLVDRAWRSGFRAGFRERSRLSRSSRGGRHRRRRPTIQGKQTEIPPVSAEWYTAQGDRWAERAADARPARAAALMAMAAAAFKAERTVLRLEGRPRVPRR